ncbi:MAG: hypothetical protein E4H14_20000 [Candidatus Thorarchaeota archaeon]|nr:MAG: hypothetical protein E4H14_20000 [Candidatus Thorarchaeota archaeon]
MFLIHKQVVEEMKLGISSSNYRFRAWRFGPFTEDVLDDVAALSTFGLMKTEGDEDATQSFLLTPKGRDAVNRTLDSEPALTRVMDEISRIKKSYGRISLEELVSKVYRQYPEYTDKSEIRERFATS